MPSVLATAGNWRCRKTSQCSIDDAARQRRPAALPAGPAAAAGTPAGPCRRCRADRGCRMMHEGLSTSSGCSRAPRRRPSRSLPAVATRIAVRVEVADDELADLALPRRQLRHVELPGGGRRGPAGGVRVFSMGALRAPPSSRCGRPFPVVLEVGVEVDVRPSTRRGRAPRPFVTRLGLRLRALFAGRRPPLPATSELSSRTGFSTSSWVSSFSSSMRVSCRSLIACCSEGVMTSFWESLSEVFVQVPCSDAALQIEIFAKVDLSHLGVRRQLRELPERKISPSLMM